MRTLFFICAALIVFGTGCGNCDGGGGGGGGSNAAPATHPGNITGARKQMLIGKLNLDVDAGSDQ